MQMKRSQENTSEKSLVFVFVFVFVIVGFFVFVSTVFVFVVCMYACVFHFSLLFVYKKVC